MYVELYCVSQLSLYTILYLYFPISYMAKGSYYILVGTSPRGDSFFSPVSMFSICIFRSRISAKLPRIMHCVSFALFCWVVGTIFRTGFCMLTAEKFSSTD